MLQKDVMISPSIIIIPNKAVLLKLYRQRQCIMCVYRTLRNRDVTKFHLELCLALLAQLLVFVVGIDRTEEFEVCVVFSVLLHYLTLVAVAWMGAVALLMFQKLVMVFVDIIVIVSLVCWCKYRHTLVEALLR